MASSGAPADAGDIRDCPAAEVLEAIAAGLPGDEIARAHAARCPRCARRIELAQFSARFASVMASNTEGMREDDSSADIFGYRVLGVLARGGQGVVYRALQETTGREVAIKVLHAGPASGSRRARARMEREIEIASALDHPGIVRIFDSVKLADGRDGLVMELIEGEPLSVWLDSRAVRDERSLLLLLAEIAEATHHAHQLGVIHRDLKPSNILVDACGRPRLLDFGVARWSEEAGRGRSLTAHDEFTGTIAYAAPEQVSDEGSAIDVRADVYALGVIGFEMLTGAPPYPSEGPLREVVARILEAEVPSRSASGLSSDAWTVLAKAMAKDRRRRYQSAGEFAADLRSAARGEAVRARADSRWYLVRKAVRRRRVPLAIAGLVAAGALATFVALAVGNTRLRSALDESRLLQIRALLDAGRREDAESALWREVARDIDPARPAGEMLWSGTAREKAMLWCFVEMQSAATCVRVRRGFAPDGLGVWSDGGQGFLIGTSGGRVARLSGAGDATGWVGGERGIPLGRARADTARVTPSGAWIVAWTAEAVWTVEAVSGERRGEISLATGEMPLVAADWGLALRGSDGAIRLLSMPGLEPLASVSDAMDSQIPWLDAEPPAMVYLTRSDLLRVVDARTGVDLEPPRPVLVPTAPRGTAIQLLMDRPRSRLIAAGGGGMRAMRLGDGPPAMVFERVGNRVAVGHDRGWTQVSAVTHGDPTLRLWDASDWRALAGLAGHRGSVVRHAFTDDGGRIATVDSAGTLRVWMSPLRSWRELTGKATSSALQIAVDPVTPRVVAPATALRAPNAESTTATMAAVSDDGVWRAVADPAGVLLLEGPAEMQRIEMGAGIAALRFRPGGGAALGVCLAQGELVLIDPATGNESRRTALGGAAEASDLAWSPDGALAAVSRRDGTITLAGSDGGSQTVDVGATHLRALAFGPDGRWLVAVGDGGLAHLLHVGDGRQRRSSRISEHSLFCLAIHPSGEVVMIGDRAGLVRAVDVNSLDELASLDAGGAVVSLAFDESGDALAVSALDRPVSLWRFGIVLETFGALRAGAE